MNITLGDIKKMYPYKKTNHFSEYYKKMTQLYNDDIFQVLHKRIFDNSNPERCIYFTNLISKIKYIQDEHFCIFNDIIVKILNRSKLFDIKKDIVELIERFIGKKLTIYKPYYEQMKNMFNQCQPKAPEMSKDGKYIYTYSTVKDLEENIVSSFYMNKHGRKGGLSDQYKIYKMKQLADKNPEYKDWKEIAECFEKLYGLESLNKKNTHTQYNNLNEYEKEFDISKKIAKDIGWI